MECAFLGFCACVGLWFIERGILPWSAPFLVFALVLVYVYRARNTTFGVCLSWFLRLCWFMFIERGILHLECAFLGFCACVGLWFIERGILQLEYASLSVRIVRIERTVSHCALM